MRGTSRASLAEARDRLSAALAGPAAAQGGQVGGELFGVTGLLDSDPALSRALSDPARLAADRADLARALLTGKVSPVTLDQVTGLVSGRWSEPSELADAAEVLAVTAIATQAEADGEVDELEDQLFRFGRITAASPDLRAALSNQFLAAEHKRDLVRALLDGKVVPGTMALVTEAAVRPRGRSMDVTLATQANIVAEQRNRLVAEVHVAVALTAEQRTRLAAALAASYGRQVHLNVVLDPEVVGGMSVRIGDELINGSVASRLAELKRNLAA